MPGRIVIRGGSLAGASAAITARALGAAVAIVEKSTFPRHKVCGEFLSPEALPILTRLGIAIEEAAPIRRVLLRFRRREKSFALPQPAFGISRYLLDDRLLARAIALGAELTSSDEKPRIVAHGRRDIAPKGERQFGFKAHFTGPSNDAVELYFLEGGYVGVNPVEGGITNVCGILPEGAIRDLDDSIAQFAPLAERLRGLTQQMPWLRVGPLVYRQRFDADEAAFLAGDALSFVDPFTGSGMLAALKSGELAGRAAAENWAVARYRAACRKALGNPFRVSTALRSFIRSGWGERLVGITPGPLLYRLTRPA